MRDGLIRIEDEFAIAEVLSDQRRFADAAARVRRVIAAEPDHARAFALLAIYLTQDKQRREALAAAEESLRLDPEDFRGHYAASLALWESGRKKPALVAAHAAVERAPYNAGLWKWLAQISLDSAKKRDARAAIDRALAIDPNDAENHATSALISLRERGEAKAEREIAAALSLAPDDGYVRWAAGVVARRRNPVATLLHFRSALRRDPNMTGLDRDYRTLAREISEFRFISWRAWVAGIVWLAVFSGGFAIDSHFRPYDYTPHPALGIWGILGASIGLIYLSRAKRRGLAAIERGEPAGARLDHSSALRE